MEDTILRQKKESGIHEGLLLFTLAAINFTHIMDFVIIMPMNPILQKVFSITNKEFGILVSAYAASAGIIGFLASFIIDKYDRRTVMLVAYFGFALSTLGCAMSGTYELFLISRIVAGAFGGVLGALVLSIVGDVIPEERRGKATGIVMSAFAAASVIGIPLGLYLAVELEWHAPFYLLAGLCLIIFLLMLKTFPSIKNHLVNRVEKTPVKMLQSVFGNPNLVTSLTFMSMLMLAGFTVVPYLADYMISNVGFTNNDLKYIYVLGGLATVVSGPLVGKLSDKYGKQKVFLIAAILSIIPIMLITTLSPVPKYIAFIITTSFFIFFGGRFVPAMAMITSSVDKQNRGGFMSINSSVQQLSSALATFLSGMVIGETVSGEITNYWIVGIFASVVTVICIYISFKIKPVS